jgi:hypothetical protein
MHVAHGSKRWRIGQKTVTFDQSSTVAARVWLQVIDIAEAGTEFSRNVVPRL